MQAEPLPERTPPSALRGIQQSRRAVRDFSPRPLERSLLDAILAGALDAPSSLGVQPYELHVVLEPGLRAEVAKACNGQRAARSAQALIAFAVGPAITRRRVEESRRHYEAAPLPPASRDYHLAGLERLSRSLAPAVLPVLGLARAWLALLRPTRAFLPLGAQGSRDWAARNAMLAASDLLLSAAAWGVDSCPMEGFDGSDVARLLDLPRGTAVSLVVALGYRAADARIEPRWRRTPAEMIVLHDVEEPR